jgi:hypothetical protein
MFQTLGGSQRSEYRPIRGHERLPVRGQLTRRARPSGDFRPNPRAISSNREGILDRPPTHRRYCDEAMAKRPGPNARAKRSDSQPRLVVKIEQRQTSLPPSLAWRRLWYLLLSSDEKGAGEPEGKSDGT